MTSRFQWAAVNAFHSRILKAIEQGITNWNSDFTRFQTGVSLLSQELVTPTMASSSRSGNTRKKLTKSPSVRSEMFLLGIYAVCQ